MIDIDWLARQFDGVQVDGVVDESQRDVILRREVAAEGAGRNVGDRRDLVDGRALESLPLAKFDSCIDQCGVGALLLAFTQTEGWLRPDFSHAGHANPPRYALALKLTTDDIWRRSHFVVLGHPVADERRHNHRRDHHADYPHPATARG